MASDIEQQCSSCGWMISSCTCEFNSSNKKIGDSQIQVCSHSGVDNGDNDKNDKKEIKDKQEDIKICSKCGELVSKCNC